MGKVRETLVGRENNPNPQRVATDWYLINQNQFWPLSRAENRTGISSPDLVRKFKLRSKIFLF